MILLRRALRPPGRVPLPLTGLRERLLRIDRELMRAPDPHPWLDRAAALARPADPPPAHGSRVAALAGRLALALGWDPGAGPPRPPGRMPEQPSTRRYVSGAAALLILATSLFAAAAPQLNAAGPGPTRAAAAALPIGAAEPGRDSGSTRPGRPLPGSLLAAARASLQRGGAGPSAEVDRWAVRLASETETSEAALARYAVYRPLIQEALRRHALPLDLAFVPWVESEWRNEATSPAGAAGIWQFMAGTARGYGLEVSEYVDERRDPVRATEAAARHLADLYRETGDWHAALASYNAGLGRAGHTRGAFWKRRATLPRETRLYVPRVLAAARVGRAPDAWGLRLVGTASPLRFREVWVPGGTPLATVAAHAGTAPGEIRALNPHLVRGTTPPGRRWPVRIPASVRPAGISSRAPGS